MPNYEIHATLEGMQKSLMHIANLAVCQDSVPDLLLAVRLYESARKAVSSLIQLEDRIQNDYAEIAYR